MIGISSLRTYGVGAALLRRLNHWTDVAVEAEGLRSVGDQKARGYEGADERRTAHRECRYDIPYADGFQSISTGGNPLGSTDLPVDDVDEYVAGFTFVDDDYLGGVGRKAVDA